MLISILNINSYSWQRYIYLSIISGIFYVVSFEFISIENIQQFIFDLFASILLMSLSSVALWNIFTYGMSDSLSNFQRVSIIVLYAVLSISLILLSEYEISILFGGDNGFFIHTLPSRILILSLLFYLFRISFLHQQKNNEEEKKLSEEYNSNSTSINDEIIYTNRDEENDVNSSIENNKTNVEKVEHISFKIGNKIKMVQVEDIVLLKAEDDYVLFYTMDGHWLKKGTMKEFLNSLPCDKFIRVHRSYIVNITKISKIECFGQKHQLQLSNEMNIWISISGYKLLREKLDL